MTGKLHYIGTNHWDLKGERRLATALQSIQPDIILSEYLCEPSMSREEKNIFLRSLISEMKKFESDPESPRARDYHGSVARLYRAIVETAGHEKRSVDRVLADKPGTKYNALEDCPEWTPKKVRFVDDQGNSHEIDEVCADLITNMVECEGRKERWQQNVDSFYVAARNGLNNRQITSEESAVIREGVEMGVLGDKRDKMWAPKVRDVVTKNDGKVVAVVAGRIHFSYDPTRNTLYSITEDLNPQVVFLSEVAGLGVGV